MGWTELAQEGWPLCRLFIRTIGLGKVWGISCLPDRLAATQEGPCFVEFSLFDIGPCFVSSIGHLDF